VAPGGVTVGAVSSSSSSGALAALASSGVLAAADTGLVSSGSMDAGVLAGPVSAVAGPSEAVSVASSVAVSAASIVAAGVGSVSVVAPDVVLLSPVSVSAAGGSVSVDALSPLVSAGVVVVGGRPASGISGAGPVGVVPGTIQITGNAAATTATAMDAVAVGDVVRAVYGVDGEWARRRSSQGEYALTSVIRGLFDRMRDVQGDSND